MGNNMELIAKKAVWARPGAGGRGRVSHVDYAARIAVRHHSNSKYTLYAIKFSKELTDLCFTKGSRVKIGVLGDNLILLPTKDPTDSYTVYIFEDGKSEVKFSTNVFPQVKEFIGEYKRINKASDCGDETLYFLAKGDKFDD